MMKLVAMNWAIDAYYHAGGPEAAASSPQPDCNSCADRALANLRGLSPLATPHPDV